VQILTFVCAYLILTFVCAYLETVSVLLTCLVATGDEITEVWAVRQYVENLQLRWNMCSLAPTSIQRVCSKHRSSHKNRKYIKLSHASGGLRAGFRHPRLCTYFLLNLLCFQMLQICCQSLLSSPVVICWFVDFSTSILVSSSQLRRDLHGFFNRKSKGRPKRHLSSATYESILM